MQSWPRMDWSLNTPLIFIISITSVNFSLYDVIWKGYKGVISWGDGTISDYTDTALAAFTVTHVYPESGKYTIAIQFSNDCPSYDPTKTRFPPSSEGMFQSVGSQLISVITPLPSVYNTMTSAERMFEYCTNLTAVNEDLFMNTLSINNLHNCFAKCSSLRAIPGGLFKNLTRVANIIGMFQDCTTLTSIPEGLFSDIPGGSSAEFLFYHCSSLSSIPEDLFFNLVNTGDFRDCFYGCSSLTSIPDRLFEKNTRAYSFVECFYGCSRVLELPSTLLRNTKARWLRRCFANCQSLTEIPSDLFEGLSEITNFEECFYHGSGITSYVPALWNLYPNATGTKCYYGCTHAANYADIPSGWK